MCIRDRETFARYGFNRSHSAAYAMISFQTGYLKAHYGVEFMAALMSNEMGDSDKTLKNFTECKKQGIVVLPPDVNESLHDFTVVGGKIRFGLSAVKGVGDKAVEAIIDARRESGEIKSLEDFATRVSLKAVNKKVIENLIKCGAFDTCAQLSRKELLSRMEDVIRVGQTLQKEKDTNQMSLFSAGDVQVGIPIKSTKEPEWPINKKLAFEKDAVGFYISGHPLDKFVGALKKLGTTPTTEIKNCKNKSMVSVGGVVTALKLKNTKKGDRYASFILEDSVGTVETLVWPDTYMRVAHILAADDPIIVSAKADVNNERCTLIVDKMESLIALRDKKATHAVIRLNEKDDLNEKVKKLVDVFSSYSGSCPVKAFVDSDEGRLSITLRDAASRPVCIQPSEELCDMVEQLFGRPVLSFL